MYGLVIAGKVAVPALAKVITSQPGGKLYEWFINGTWIDRRSIVFWLAGNLGGCGNAIRYKGIDIIGWI
jgi:hypothetical protein